MSKRVCPWWWGYFLMSPIRRIYQNPRKILNGFVEKGMSCLDIGSGMGYFTIPMAKMTGDAGKIYAVDLQAEMLRALKKNAEKAGLSQLIELVQCSEDSLGIEHLKGKIDFILAFAVIHEIPNQPKAFFNLYNSLKKGGMLFMAEPVGHVPQSDFSRSIDIATMKGFKIREKSINIRGTNSILLIK